MFAGARKLDNLVVIVDNNGLQIDGSVADVRSPYPIDKKFEAFNFHVINIDAPISIRSPLLSTRAKETRDAPPRLSSQRKRKRRILYGKPGILARFRSQR